MKKTIKLLALSMMLLVGFSFYSCSDDKDEAIEEINSSYDKLPAEAKKFITEFFSYTLVTKVDMIDDDGEILYEVDFEDGSEVVFNSEGIWQQVDAPEGKVIPDGIAPQAIVDYLNEYYADYGITEINKTGYGYNVELITGLDLMFGPEGDFIGFNN